MSPTANRMVNTFMDDFAEILKKRSLPGTLIFDLEGTLLYSNRETLEMIADLGECEDKREENGPRIPGEIFDLCRELRSRISQDADGHGTLEVPAAILTNGRDLTYSLRAFPIGGQSRGMGPSHLMVLVERIIPRHEVDLEKARADFKLSRREVSVLKQLCEGDTNKEISDKLFICEYTVKDHIKKIMRKMGVNSRNEIMAALK